MIDEETAWGILDRYVTDCLRMDSRTLLAVYAIGSLGGGYYRPGESDIDAVLIVQNGSERIWGNGGEPSPALRELNRRYLERYRVPKDFGVFPLQERELFPPYGPEVPSEIARLKVQGKCVYGNYDLDALPMPTAADFVREAQHFEEWWRDGFSKSMPSDHMSPTACASVILIHVGRFLRIKRGVIEFNKCRQIRCYLENEPPFVDEEVFALVQAVLDLRKLSAVEQEQLRKGMVNLRDQMNKYLGIVL